MPSLILTRCRQPSARTLRELRRGGMPSFIARLIRSIRRALQQLTRGQHEDKN